MYFNHSIETKTRSTQLSSIGGAGGGGQLMSRMCFFEPRKTVARACAPARISRFAIKVYPACYRHPCTSLVFYFVFQVLASRAVKDEELENVATIASRFLRRSKKANRRLMETQIAAGHGGGSGGGDGNGDDCHKWMRQKVDVKTDEWHRVRALPLYCSSSSG